MRGFTVCHHSASLVMPNGDPRDGFFCPALTLMIYSYILTVLAESVESWTPVIIRILKDGIARSDLPRGLQEKHKKTLQKRTLRLKKADVIPLFTRPPQVGFHARIQRAGGGGGGRGPVDSNMENHKAIGFLSNTGPDPRENHKTTKPAINVGPSSAHQRNTIKMIRPLSP